MNSLRIQFIIRFDLSFIDHCPFGPLTHRWLPEGEKDSILLNVGHSDYELKVEFEHGGMRRSSKKHNLEKQEMDITKILKEGILDAGPMTCNLTIKNIEDEKYEAVTNNIQNEHYEKFAKEIIQRVFPSLNNFLRLLRFKHGQYWIDEIGKFNSRECSLGTYCGSLNMKWSNNNGKNWNDFHPTTSVLSFDAYLTNKQSFLNDYITKADWSELSKSTNTDFPYSLSKELCIKSWEYFDQKDIKHAIIEGITALEVCLSEVVNQGLVRLNSSIDKIDDFKHSRLTTKLIIISSFKPIITETELNNSIELYDIRNKIVHDGEKPPEAIKIGLKFKSLLNTISKITMDQEFKFPSTNAGNLSMPNEEWEKLNNSQV